MKSWVWNIISQHYGFWYAYVHSTIISGVLEITVFLAADTSLTSAFGAPLTVTVPLTFVIIFMLARLLKEVDNRNFGIHGMIHVSTESVL